MKKSKFVVYVVVLSISIIPILCDSKKEVMEPVHDIKGRRLRVDQPYNVLPSDPSTDLGFNMEVIGNKTCPFDVIIEVKGFYQIPLQLYPINSTKGEIVRTSKDLNVFFWNTFTSCLAEYSNFWRVGDYDQSIGKKIITTGGERGNPGPKTISNWFKIEKAGGSYYKFVFCPSVCKTCKIMCKDVGIFVDENGKRRAVLSDVPFKFSFEKFTGFTPSS